MTPNVRKHLHAIFDAHDAALAALRAVNREILTANQAFTEAAHQFDLANRSFTAMVHAHDTAIQAAMAANRGALDLLDSLAGGA
jgi:hypothetical protein